MEQERAARSVFQKVLGSRQIPQPGLRSKAQGFSSLNAALARLILADTIYVSGATCSTMDNATQDFGADMADYPYETVPNKVRQLFRSQLMQHKVSATRRFRGESVAALDVDRLVPIIADADTGHGGQTANMKLAKLFVEAGAAAIHLDDQVPGTKKFGAKTAGRVLVPVEEHITRLLAVKLQFDVMG
jgi:isocitrate lyase